MVGDFLHSLYLHFTIVELKEYSSTSINMKQWYNTTRYIHLSIAEDRERWKLLTPKSEIGNQAKRLLLRTYCSLHIACEKIYTYT